MGSSHSTNSKGILRYYHKFDERPVVVQNYITVEHRHLEKILNGKVFEDKGVNLFKDEVVKFVWIYYCPLMNQEGAIEGATVLGSIAATTAACSFLPGINLVTIPVAAATGTAAAISGGIASSLNHQFVMIKTKKWLYVVAKGKGGCECFRAPHHLKSRLLDTQTQYIGSRRRGMQPNPAAQVWKEDTGEGSLFDMIRWMKNERIIEEAYDWTDKNCKKFAQALFNLLARSERC